MDPFKLFGKFVQHNANVSLDSSTGVIRGTVKTIQVTTNGGRVGVGTPAGEMRVFDVDNKHNTVKLVVNGVHSGGFFPYGADQPIDLLEEFRQKDTSAVSLAEFVDIVNGTNVIEPEMCRAEAEKFCAAIKLLRYSLSKFKSINGTTYCYAKDSGGDLWESYDMYLHDTMLTPKTDENTRINHDYYIGKRENAISTALESVQSSDKDDYINLGEFEVFLHSWCGFDYTDSRGHILTTSTSADEQGGTGQARRYICYPPLRSTKADQPSIYNKVFNRPTHAHNYTPFTTKCLAQWNCVILRDCDTPIKLSQDETRILKVMASSNSGLELPFGSNNRIVYPLKK